MLPYFSFAAGRGPHIHHFGALQRQAKSNGFWQNLSSVMNHALESPRRAVQVRAGDCHRAMAGLDHESAANAADGDQQFQLAWPPNARSCGRAHDPAAFPLTGRERRMLDVRSCRRTCTPNSIHSEANRNGWRALIYRVSKQKYPSLNIHAAVMFSRRASIPLHRSCSLKACLPSFQNRLDRRPLGALDVLI
jgi:hypothetical protein